MSFFYKWYPQIISGLNKTIDLVFSLLNTFITTIGIPILIAGLIYFEYSRLKEGFMQIKSSEHLAIAGSLVLIAANMVAEVMVVNQEFYDENSEEQKEKFSLPNLLSGIFYSLGITHLFYFVYNLFPVEEKRIVEKRYIKDADSFSSLVVLITFVIMAISTLGSMDVFFENEQFQDENIFTIFPTVIIEGNPQETLIFLSGILATIVAVLAPQRLINFITFRALEELERISNISQKILEDESNVKIFTDEFNGNKIPEGYSVEKENDKYRVVKPNGEKTKWYKRKGSLEKLLKE